MSETLTAKTGYHAQQCYHEGCQWREKDEEIQRLRAEVVRLNKRIHNAWVAVAAAFEQPT